METTPRLLIVSYAGAQQGFPRGERTQAFARELSANWSVEVLSGPHPPLIAPAGVSSRPGISGLRRTLRRLRDSLLIDKYEPWSRRRTRGWRPHADLGLLIGPPFSLVAETARHLSQAGIPYVVDVGDPWAL